MTSKKPLPLSFMRILLLVFLPFTGGYFITSFFNQVNSVLAPYLLHSIHMRIFDLGVITSIYFLGVGIAQILLGTLLDHYGPRKVEATLLIIAGLGIMIFATATTPIQLFIGRGLIGIGVSSGLIAGFKAIRLWFPRDKIPLANGSFMATGSLGVIASTLPVEWSLEFMSWQHLLLILCAFTFVISACIFFIVPNHPSQEHLPAKLTLERQLLETKKIFSSRYFWRIFPVATLAFDNNMAIVGLWAGPWFSSVAGFDNIEIARHLFAIALALILGIVLWGVIADRVMHLLKRPITFVLGIGLFFYLSIQMLLVIGIAPGSYLLWILFGFSSRSLTLAYAALSQHFHMQYVGRASAILTMFFFASTFIVQMSMGAIINLFPKNAADQYPVIAYHTAFGSILALQILAYLWFLLFRNTEPPDTE
jgi:MFS family permease